MVLTVGGVGAGAIVSRKLMVVVRLAVLVTLIEIVAEPAEAGCTTMARLAPLPPKVMLAFGTALWLLELAVTTRLAGGVSASPIVKFRIPVPLGKVTF